MTARSGWRTRTAALGCLEQRQIGSSPTGHSRPAPQCVARRFLVGHGSPGTRPVAALPSISCWARASRPRPADRPQVSNGCRHQDPLHGRNSLRNSKDECGFRIRRCPKSMLLNVTECYSFQKIGSSLAGCSRPAPQHVGTQACSFGAQSASSCSTLFRPPLLPTRFSSEKHSEQSQRFVVAVLGGSATRVRHRQRTFRAVPIR
jgi:hypothetical protein